MLANIVSNADIVSFFKKCRIYLILLLLPPVYESVTVGEMYLLFEGDFHGW